MRKTKASTVALGGMMAALAVTIMCLGGLIPIATFVCPIMCMLLLRFVMNTCGVRIGWAWYGAVAILSLLLGPDKEAAAVFAALGYYPMLKPRLDRMKLGMVLKLALFNVVILAMYWVLIHLLGMDRIAAEYEELGTAMTMVTLLLGNLTFFMTDLVLGKQPRRRK
ncbi:MAG: hypothetical protein IJ375_04960 [Oscillospiraceae bacterium]|nr:hypothetical protein [Oscillospiraceae bacterium]